jgi:hypothetical protein
MAVNFPVNPIDNQEFEAAGIPYIYNGYGWAIKQPAGSLLAALEKLKAELEAIVPTPTRKN